LYAHKYASINSNEKAFIPKKEEKKETHSFHNKAMLNEGEIPCSIAVFKETAIEPQFVH
jgi:hypothetical protein